MPFTKSSLATAMVTIGLTISCQDKTEPFNIGGFAGGYYASMVINGGASQNALMALNSMPAGQFSLSFDPLMLPNLVGNISSTYDNHVTHCPSGAGARCPTRGLTFTIIPIDTLINEGLCKLDEVTGNGHRTSTLIMKLKTPGGSISVIANRYD